MANKILIVLFLFIGLNVYSAEQSTADKALEVTEKTIDKSLNLAEKVGSKVWEATQAIAESLQVSAKHVYTIITMKYIAIGVTYLLALICFIVLMYLFIRIVDNIKFVVVGNYNVKMIDLKSTIKLLSVLIALYLTGSIALPNIDNMLIYLIAPEYGTIKEITELVKVLLNN